MDTLISELQKVASSGSFAQPIVIAVGNNRVVIPPPVATGEDPATYCSVALFPDGAPGIDDFAAMLGTIKFSDLPAPLNAVGNVTISRLAVEFAGTGPYPSRISAEFGYGGTIIGFQNASVANISLTCECVMPLDQLLAATTIYTEAELNLDGARLPVEIGATGRALFLLNNGEAVNLDAIQKLVSRGGWSQFQLPVPDPAFENVLVEFSLTNNDVSISADIASDGLDFFGSHVTLSRLSVHLGTQCSALVVASGSIGSLGLSGLIELPGSLSLCAEIPAIRPAELIAAAIPQLAAAAKPLAGIEFPESTLTLTKDGSAETLFIETELNPAQLVAEPVKTFLTHIGVEIPQDEVSTDLTVIPQPLTARLSMAMLSEKPVELIKNSKFFIEGLRLEFDAAAQNPAFGLGADLEFTFSNQTFELAGTILAKIDEATIQATQKKPAIWKDALGIEGLDLSDLNLVVGLSYAGVPTIGFGGKFLINAAELSGSVAFLFDAGNPGTSVLSLSFSKIDLAQCFDLFFPARAQAPVRSVLRQISFEDCNLYFAPEGCTIAGVGYPAGFRIRGDAAFFGWGNKLDVQVEPAHGMMFDCEMDKAVKLAGVFALHSATDSKRGPHLAFSTDPKPALASLTASGVLEIAGAFRESTTVTFDETSFHVDVTTTFFCTPAVSLKADAEFAQIANSGLIVHLTLTGIDKLAGTVNSALKNAAHAAASALSEAQDAVRKAKHDLAPLKSAYEGLQRELSYLKKKYNHASIIEKPYWAARIATTEGEIAAAWGPYHAAELVLEGAEKALGAVKTVENAALNTIAGFIDTTPVQIESVKCDVKASELQQPQFTVAVELQVMGKSQTLKLRVDFSNAHMVGQLAQDIKDGIVKMFE